MGLLGAAGAWRGFSYDTRKLFFLHLVVFFLLFLHFYISPPLLSVFR